MSKDDVEKSDSLDCSAFKITLDICNELRDRWAMACDVLAKTKPLVVGVECYEFFGEWVKIVEVNMFDQPHNAEVVIESRMMERKRVEFSELSWRTNYRLADAMCRKSRNEVIVEGSK